MSESILKRSGINFMAVKAGIIPVSDAENRRKLRKLKRRYYKASGKFMYCYED